MRRIAEALTLAWLAAPHPASAACAPAISPTAERRLTEASVPAAAVKGWQAAPLLKDRNVQPGCPDEVAACEQPASVEPGEVVLLNGVAVGGYACATFAAPGGAVASGWLAVWRLAVYTPTTPEPDDWTGEWAAPGRAVSVALTASGDLTLVGSASGAPGGWRARLPPSGAILAFTDQAGRTLPFDDGEPSDCRMQLARRGPYLVVQDDGACGAGGSFTGMYRRTPP